MHQPRHSLPLAICVLTLLVAIARAPTTPAAQTRTPIKIGVLAPLSGPLAALARDIVDGARLYGDEVNGEMVGRKVELIVEDYEFKSAVALTKTKKLVERDGVHAVLGVILSAAAIAMKDYIHAQQVPFIISGAAVAEPLMIEKPSPYVFRTTFSASQVPTPLAKFTYDKLKARTATVIAGDTVGTIELVMGFARAFEEAGGKVVQQLYAPIGTTDFGPFIGRMRRDVDIVAALVAGADGIRFIKQYEEFGLKGKIQVVDTAPGITDISLLPSSGPSALGMYASQPYVYTIDNPKPEIRAGVSRQVWTRPGRTGEAAYVALAAIHQALTATGGNIEDKAKFLEALRRMDLEAPRGRVRFDQYQNIITDVMITRIDKVGDQIVPVVVETIPGVDQFLGMAPEAYIKRPRLVALKGTLANSGGEVAMDFWIVQTLNGLSFGMLLFLLAAGLSLVFGLMRIVNLTHGSFYLLGAYIGLAVIERTGSFLLALVVAPVCRGTGSVYAPFFAAPFPARGAGPGAPHLWCALHLCRFHSVAVGRLFLRAAETRFPGRVTDAREHRLPHLSALCHRHRGGDCAGALARARTDHTGEHGTGRGGR